MWSNMAYLKKKKKKKTNNKYFLELSQIYQKELNQIQAQFLLHKMIKSFFNPSLKTSENCNGNW